MEDKPEVCLEERWAHLRFSIVGPLLSAPPKDGELKAALKALAQRLWLHPVTGEQTTFTFPTIERWYYLARDKKVNPVEVLRKKARCDRGRQPSLSDPVRQALRIQHAVHAGWSVQLHFDNLVAQAKEDPALGAVPSYSSVKRFMRGSGLVRVQRPGGKKPTAGQLQAAERLARLEVRSYEVDHVGGLWHLDFHNGSLKVLLPEGEWATPVLLGVLDDRSRLGCHLQWYLREAAQELAHGLQQAFLKRGLPRGLMTDRGAAMLAAEIQDGLRRLGIDHQPTLPYSPYQNGKQESFWNQVEGRLLAMLEGVPDLTLELLNRATQAWLEGEYHRAIHSETGQTPLERFLAGPDLLRDSPSPEDLRFAFCATSSRSQRKGDGTVSLESQRFEVPARYRHLRRVHVRYAPWDLTRVWLVDPSTSKLLAPLYPLDKAKNASGARRRLPQGDPPPAPPAASGIAPRLRQLMAEYALTGLPPAYVPMTTDSQENEQ
ncbi:MAG: DDE-type integrase/transposase/recombinase [Thermoanaerobaculaceae bacterium]|nr:DDE-type integrase/transposase/recombinase [Thermoanaerobaculaceae bacterium]